MNGRDGRYDSGGFDDADWLLSQLGSGRRPDLEGRTTPPQPPVAPEPFAPPAAAEPTSAPSADRARRRTEESLDWFSLAEPAGETDAVTRALPVVGDPIPGREPEPQQAPNEPEPCANPGISCRPGNRGDLPAEPGPAPAAPPRRPLRTAGGSAPGAQPSEPEPGEPPAAAPRPPAPATVRVGNTSLLAGTAPVPLDRRRRP